jgi:hypothetical protein
MAKELATQLQLPKQGPLQLHYHFHFHYLHLVVDPAVLLEPKPVTVIIANATVRVTVARHHSRLFEHTSCLYEDTCNIEGCHFY